MAHVVDVWRAGTDVQCEVVGQRFYALADILRRADDYMAEIEIEQIERKLHAQTLAQSQPVPVAAQPRYVLDKDAILELVSRYGNACAQIADAGSYREQMKFIDESNDLFDAIRAALTPVPAVDWPLPAVEIEQAETAGLVVRPESPAAEPAWGSGPLVDHNPETPGTADPIPCPSLRCRCPWCRQMRDPAGELK